MIKCDCGQLNNNTSSFCTKCGKRMFHNNSIPVCPKCSSGVEEDAKYCPSCGVNLNRAGIERNKTYEMVMKKLAETGNAEAMFNLAMFYYNRPRDYYAYDKPAGNNGEYNSKKVVSWLEKAKSKGHAGAAYELGMMYALPDEMRIENDVISFDINKAVSNFAYAAERGHAEGAYQLALKSDYPDDDLTDEYCLFCKAAELGSDAAQYEIGDFYNSGFFVKQNTEMAVEYYIKSALQGNEDAIDMLKWHL